LVAALAALLFLGYLRVSWTVAATSDGAAQALQARDMLAGNWLLHGWTVSDVSFYTTELPEYMLVELVRPFGVGIIHVAAAATYTLLVLAAFALARGRSRGPAGLVRGVLAAGIMLAPQPGYGAFVLLLSPDHVGTQVPLLACWLLLDRARSSPGAPLASASRRWVPVALCLLLAWVQLADRVALVTGVLPLVLVCVVAVVRTVADSEDLGSMSPLWGVQRSKIFAAGGSAGRNRARRPKAVWRGRPLWVACQHEVTLVLAAAGSVGLAWAGARALAGAGGFAAHPLPFTLAPLRLLWTHAWLTGWGILELYGANFLGVAGWAGRAFAVLHLAGLALAAAALVVALGRFLRPRRVAGTGPARSAPPAQGIRPAPAGQGRGIQSAPLGALCIPRLAQGERGAGPESTGGAGAPGGNEAAPAADLVDSVLAVAIVANLASYVLSIEPGTVLGTGYDAREIAAVLPLGAVLAGRVVGPWIAHFLFHEISGNVVARQRPTFPDGAGLRGRVAASRGGLGGACGETGLGRGTRNRSGSSVLAVLMVWAFVFVVGGYAVALGYSATRPGAAGRYAVLADWLVAHGLRYGLGGASSNVVTVDSGGRAVVAATQVRAGRVRPLLYQSSTAAYDPGYQRATFLVAGAPADGAGYAAEDVPAAVVRATFGRPARVYRFDGFTVDVWDVNLLTKMRG